ncbi:MAG: Protein-export membrane protein SecF [Candidatus Methanogaster sp.]|nr:MAG: Protein-export membrane protein SecF [ANME-2 cluster archaeon]
MKPITHSRPEKGETPTPKALANLISRFDSYIRSHKPVQLAIPPLIVLAIALIVLGGMYVTTGSPVRLGFEFEGGTIITLATDDSHDLLRQTFADYPVLDVRDSGGRRWLKFGPMSEDTQNSLTEMVNTGYEYAAPEIKQAGALYGASLQTQALKALVVSFCLMAVIVLLIFRTFVPSVAVVLSAFSDIMIAAAFIAVAGIELSLGTVAALLMLIGYSVDSDILLTTRLLKRRGNLDDKVTNAMTTGLTMTGTTLAAITVMYLVATYSYLIIPGLPQISIISDISIVLLAGLFADLMNTWMLNTGILKWHLQRARRRRA